MLAAMTARSPSLLALRAFDAAARHSSFKEAARELHVTQAAISRHVRGLESDLGRALFRRLHRRVQLTGPGKRLAVELAAGFSQIKRAVDATRVSAVRRLRISVEPVFAARWLVPRFGRFTAAHPDIEVDLESSEELRSLGRDTDVAIRFLDSATRKPGGTARKLFAVAGFPVISAAKAAPGSRRRDDRDILGFRLLHDDDGTIWRRWFAASGMTGYDKAKHLYFNDYSLTLTATLRGQGVALSAPIYVRSQLRSGRLKRIGRTPVNFGDYWLLQASDRGSTKARTAFVDWFLGEMQGIAPTAGGPTAGRVRPSPSKTRDDSSDGHSR